MYGTLATICPACGEHVTWTKVTWGRPDGYPDWDLDIRCKCGVVTDELIKRDAWADYRVMARADIHAMQNATLDKALGKEVHMVLEAMCRGKNGI